MPTLVYKQQPRKYYPRTHSTRMFCPPPKLSAIRTVMIEAHHYWIKRPLFAWGMYIIIIMYRCKNVCKDIGYVRTYLTIQDWSSTEVTAIVRLVRSTNIALGLSSFAIVVISPPQDLELQQQDCKVQIAYLQDTSAASKGDTLLITCQYSISLVPYNV